MRAKRAKFRQEQEKDMSTAYNQLAQALRGNIISGKWPTGSKIETERELCGRYGFSRITVRQALRALEEENLIVRRQGLGTFVNVRSRRKIPIVRGDFTHSVLKHAPNITRKIMECKQCRAGDELSKQLGVPPGETIVLARRLDTLGNRPAAVDEVAMPLRYADRLLKSDWAAIDFIERWRSRQGLALDHESQVIEAVPAAGALPGWLKVPRGYPLLLETNFIYLSGGDVAAKFISYYSCKYYQFNSVDRRIGDHPKRTGNPARGLPSPDILRKRGNFKTQSDATRLQRYAQHFGQENRVPPFQKRTIL